MKLNTSQLNDGAVCIVGGGDSGVQIAQELANTDRDVIVSCSNSSLLSIPQEFLGKTLWWWFVKTGLLSVNIHSRFGAWLSSKMQPIIGTDLKALFKMSNVKRVGKTILCNKFDLVFDDAEEIKVSNVIWATGFKPDYSILKFDHILNKSGYPKQYRGTCTEVEGLYFIGLPWMYTRGSATLGGVGKDAIYLSEQLSKKKLPLFDGNQLKIEKKEKRLIETV